MATLSILRPTLLDRAKSFGPDGKIAKIVEILSQSNSTLQDIVMKEGNLPTGEQTSIRTGLPEVYYRQINAGVPSSKSTSAQVVENAAILEARSHVDVDLADLAASTSEYRAQEGMAFLEAMAQKQETTLFYGAASSPEEYVGLSNRYSLLSAANGENIIDAGGSSSDNASCWLVGWSENTICGVYPKGSTAGLTHEDLGKDDVLDANGNTLRVYKDLFKWKMGLVVKDWRYGVRIANIDVSDLQGATGTQASTAATQLINLMARAIDHIPNQNSAKLCFYANRTVVSHLRIQFLNKSSAAVTIEPAINQFGKTIQEMRFLGIPVRLSDALTSAEARVV